MTTKCMPILLAATALTLGACDRHSGGGVDLPVHVSAAMDLDSVMSAPGSGYLEYSVESRTLRTGSAHPNLFSSPEEVPSAPDLDETIALANEQPAPPPQAIRRGTLNWAVVDRVQEGADGYRLDLSSELNWESEPGSGLPFFMGSSILEKDEAGFGLPTSFATTFIPFLTEDLAPGASFTPSMRKTRGSMAESWSPVAWSRPPGSSRTLLRSFILWRLPFSVSWTSTTRNVRAIFACIISAPCTG